jgi:hypothetical protein
VCCNCEIEVKPGTRFVVCDDEDDAAAPYFQECGPHPAFDAPDLEAALGASEPPRPGLWPLLLIVSLASLVGGRRSHSSRM